ncbi:SDR family NAD(P)-dependent oxidoreductase, partial [Lutimonas sp.]|uniref:SDR family NAD(P)-dependent oxidoreductase n=1 Tax=Lutimonas sp. TaxID=1872403 RepID=UPI003D9AF308
MNLELDQKTVFITGSTSGIGFAMAEGFLDEGAKVIINGRSQKSVDAAMARLQTNRKSAKVTGIAVDFKDPKSIGTIKDNIPQVDILINNVGIFSSQSFEATTDAHWQDMIQVNLISGVQLSRWFLPKMIDRNWGRILFVSSECAQLVPEDLIAYSTTKAALLSLSRGLAQTTKGSKVTVNTIIPGSTLTQGAQDFLKEQAKNQGVSRETVAQDFFSTDRNSSLLQRFAEPKEIANMALFLCSPLSAATNG